jgi:hypothetical protein
MSRGPLTGGIAVGIGILCCVAAWQSAGSADVGWQEIAWPYPRDGWPPGRAYRCSAAACGEEIDLYVRPKLGFCNCESGVADDDEVDRVADIDLISAQFAPAAPGKVVHVAHMPGRMRSYALQNSDGTRRQAIGIAASRRCDLMVAVVLSKSESPGVAVAALNLLDSDAMVSWMTASMNSR